MAGHGREKNARRIPKIEEVRGGREHELALLNNRIGLAPNCVPCVQALAEPFTNERQTKGNRKTPYCLIPGPTATQLNKNRKEKVVFTSVEQRTNQNYLGLKFMNTAKILL
jgi:hypothetical protein